MAYTTIDKPTDYFNTKLTTGTGNSQAVTGLGFQPDWIWGKRRDSSGHNSLFDSVRGITKGLESNQTGAEFTSTDYYSSFDSDGFTIASGGGGAGNGSSQTAVQWNWLAGGTASSNSNGSITSSVSANTTAGFSIVSWTGSNANATIGHGLSSAPEFITIKNRNDASSWLTYLTTIGAGNFLRLNETNASASGSTPFNNTASTSSVFSVGENDDTNGSSDSMIAYCFSSVKGYSKIGSYTGNGNADGTFVYTGFKPAFFMIKRTTGSGYDWLMYDNKRQVSFNVIDDFLNANSNAAETTGNANQSLDFLSNGVKHRGNGASSNGSGVVYIYMAFAESPFTTSTGVPTTAR
jgi:hypothetical protein